MEDRRFNINALALLIFAMAFFFDDSGLLPAVLPAVAVHEFGHVAALRMSGAKLRYLRFSIFGFELDYSGEISRRAEMFSLAAGPLAGLIYAVAACVLFQSRFWRCSGELSVMLSIFNLLPIPPLDGGRLSLLLFSKRNCRKICLFSLCLMFALGAVTLLRHGSIALLLPAVFLFTYNMCV